MCICMCVSVSLSPCGMHDEIEADDFIIDGGPLWLSVL